MKNNKKKIAILCGMLVLLVATGVLNFYLSERAKTPAIDDGQAVSTYFSSYRDDREATRQETFTYLDTIIASEDTSAEAKAAAEAQKLELCTKMEDELTLENLIKARGFDEAVVTMSTENVNVVVSTPDTLESAEVAQILTIITTETEYTPAQVIVVPYT